MANSALIPRLKTPGVYIEEIALFPPSVAQVETAIPAFIGHTQIAKETKEGDLLNKPYRITSMVDYRRYFGGPDKEKNIRIVITGEDEKPETVTTMLVEFPMDSYATTGTAPATDTELKSARRSPYCMYFALQAYFANGGGPCYIVSIGGYKEPADDTPAAPTPPPQTVQPKEFSYAAIDESLLKGTDGEGGLSAVAKVDEVTLLVFPEEQKVGSRSKYDGVQQAALLQCFVLKDRFCIMSLYDSTSKITNDRDSFRKIGLDASMARYGAAYYPNLETVFEYFFDDGDVQITHSIKDGKPGKYDGKTLKAISPNGDDKALQSNAVYVKAKSLLSNVPYILSPSPVMAGVYANVDSSRGVWKAPANVAVKAVKKPVVIISDADHGDLNIDVDAGKSINAIRTFPGRGTLVWGARTLTGNDNEWRYISVRRFFNMVEESVKKATVQFVFEPNDANTWVRVKSMIDNFLTLQWRAGALAGAVPEQAFYVNVGLGSTMTSIDILEGRMIVEIGMAVVRPAEFIILQFMHKMQES